MSITLKEEGEGRKIKRASKQLHSGHDVRWKRRLSGIWGERAQLLKGDEVDIEDEDCGRFAKLEVARRINTDGWDGGKEECERGDGLRKERGILRI